MMTVEEARNIVRYEDHAPATYDLAEHVLVEAGDFKFAYAARRLADVQRRQNELLARMRKEWQRIM